MNAPSQENFGGPVRPSQELLLDFVESTEINLFATDREHRYILANQAYASLVGRSVPEVLGRTYSDLFPRDLAEKFTAVSEEIMTEGVAKRTDTAFPDRVVMSVKSPMRDKKGSVVGVAGVLIDITERKRLECALRESEERYRSVIASMSEGVVLHGADGAIIAHNGRAEAILGLFRDQLAGKTSADLDRRTLRRDGSPYPGDEHPSMITLRTGRPCKDEIMGIAIGGGRVRWINVNTEPLLRPGDAAPYAAVATFDDITERIEEHERLRVSESRLARALVAARMGAWEFNVKDRTAVISPYLERIFGYESSPPRTTFDHFLSHILPEDRPVVEKNFQEAFSGRQPHEIDYRIRRLDGQVRWLRTNCELEMDADGGPRAICGLTKDITEQKEKEARKAKREQGQHEPDPGAAHPLEPPRQAHEELHRLGAVAHGFRRVQAEPAEVDSGTGVRPE